MSAKNPTQPDFLDAIILTSIAFLLSAILAWGAVYALFLKAEGDAVLGWRQGAVASAQFALSRAHLSLPQRQIGSWPGAPSWESIEAYYRRYPIEIRAIRVSTWTGLSIGCLFAILAFISAIQPYPKEYHRKGPKLTKSAKEIGRHFDGPDDGIKIHPSLRISQDRESRHLLLIGGSGSGKTQILGHLLESILSRGDSAIVFDFKGDLTSRYFLAGETALLAPWDSRSWKLAIGRDIRVKEHAAVLAKAILPDRGADPMWPAAARILATAVFCACMDERPGEWTLSDAVRHLTLSDEHLQLLVERFAPEGARLIEHPQSRATQSIFVTLHSHLAPLFALAEAWQCVPDERSVSIREWLQHGTPRRIILQGNGELQGLAGAVVQSVFQTLLGSIASPELPDSRSRRRWFIGDEFLQFGKVEQLGALLQTARSKGVRFVLAAQDIPGVRAVYGGDAAASLTGAAATTIVTQTNCPVTREWASKLIGEQTIERFEQSLTYGRDGKSETARWVEITRPLLSPENFGSLLGQFKVGKSSVTRAVIIGARDYVGLLDWPRYTPAGIAAAHVPLTVEKPSTKTSESPAEAEQPKRFVVRKRPSE